MKKITTLMAILIALSLAGCTVKVEMPQDAQMALRMQTEQVQLYDTLADFYDQLGFDAFTRARELEDEGKLAESQAYARRAKEYVELRMKMEALAEELRQEYDLPLKPFKSEQVSIPFDSSIDLVDK